MRKVADYLSLVKFSHTIFAMPFAMVGFFLGVESLRPKAQPANEAQAVPTPVEWFLRFTSDQPRLLLLVVLCMVFARSAAMAFNRYLDRRIDALNPRTSLREIPSGIIPARNAWVFTLLMCVLFIAAASFINTLCLLLSPVALAVILGYSYTKRFTSLCHLVLGLGLSLAPIGAYLAVTGAFALLPLLFSAMVLLWVGGFDTIYAMQDEAFDRRHGLHSIPARLGGARALALSRAMHAVVTALVLLAGYHGGFALWYWAGAACFIGMLVYQHSIVSADDLRKVDIAFMTANGIASIAFSGLVITDILT